MSSTIRDASGAPQRGGSPSAARAWRSRLGGLVVGLLALVLLDQALLHLVLDGARLGGLPLAPYDPPLFVPVQEEALDLLRSHVETGEPSAAALRHDPQLGWTAPLEGRTDPLRTFDGNGARTGPEPLADERSEGLRRIICLGDSFTFGAEVADDEAWSYLLDMEREDLELANLGVGGHGLGQTLLRWRRDGVRLAPDEVWLGWLPSAAQRVVTVYRPAQNHRAAQVLPKPRFRLGPGGELELVPNPAPELAEVVELLSDSARFHEVLSGSDLWVERWPAAYAPRGSHPVHHSALGRLALTLLEQRGRSDEEHLGSEEAEVRALTRALVLQCREEAEALGARFRLLVFAGRTDLSAATPYWGDLVADLEERGVEVIDLVPCTREAQRAEGEALWMPGGHLSPEGNRRLAAELSRRVELGPAQGAGTSGE